MRGCGRKVRDNAEAWVKELASVPTHAEIADLIRAVCRAKWEADLGLIRSVRPRTETPSAFVIAFDRMLEAMSPHATDVPAPPEWPCLA